MHKPTVLPFPGEPVADERITRLTEPLDKDKDVAAYVLLLVSPEGWSTFAFAVPNNHSEIDRMIGTLDRVRHRLIQYCEGERG